MERKILEQKTKVLVIRLSSFGDIVQCLGSLGKLKETLPQTDIHFLTKKEFSNLVEQCPLVDQVISFDKSKGFIGWIRLLIQIRRFKYLWIYDAHNNIRTFLLKLIHFDSQIFSRSKERLKRMQLFSLGINLFPKPFRGIASYIYPLSHLGSVTYNPKKEQVFQSWQFNSQTVKKVDGLISFKKYIALAPSAAWPVKRWPKSYWYELIKSLPQHQFVILGGPGDDFCADLEMTNSLNMAGKLSLIESCYVVSQAQLLVSGDTGMMDVADLLGIRGISLMGPTAFGFATNSQIKTLEVPLVCRPCSKDGRHGCKHPVYQKCMIDINPSWVKSEILEMNVNS